MELQCAVVFALVSLLSVKATPHGYGAKGGAVARAEANAAAGAFSGVGLPLSIPSGPGFSGSFSKSSSSSFASSSASSSSSSFSFSGSGASGYGLNSLGSSGSEGCAGGCKGGQSVSNGINDSHGSGSAGNGLQSLSTAKAQAAAGAYAGSLGDSKNEVHGPCTSGVCSGQKSPCEGLNCKDTSEACKSGQCGPKPSETTLPDHDHEGCASGQCDVDSESVPDADSFNCKNGNCNGNTKIKPYPSSTDKNCASGQCGTDLPSNTAIGNIPSNDKCTSGKCGAPAPGKDYEFNDIPVSVSSTSTSPHNYDHHLSNSAKASTITMQSGGTDCKYGNCASPSPNTKPYGYPGSNTYNPNQPQTAVIGEGPNYNKPATHLTAPKQEATCTYPNCNAPRPDDSSLTTPNLTPGKVDCAGGNCDNRPSNKYPSPNNGYSQPQNTHLPSGSPSSQCDSPNCHAGKDESKPEKPSYGHYPSGQTDNGYPSKSNIPGFSQGHSPNSPGNCASGNCGVSPSYQPNYDIQVSKIPIHPQSSPNTPHCASGNCEKSPVPPVGTGTFKPTIPSHPPTSPCAFGPCDDTNHHTDFSYPRLPSYPQNIQPNRPLNCASGNCPNYPSQTSSTSPVGSKFPISSGQPLAPGCTSGNCESRPTYQHGSFGSSGFQNKGYSGANHGASPPSSPNPTGSKFPIAPHEQPSVSGSPSCTSGNCGGNPAYQHGTFGSAGFQSPSYSGASPAATSQPNHDQIGSKLPIPHGQPSLSVSPGCTSGNCGNSPAYHQGSFSSSEFQNPSHTGAHPAINCASGNCPNYPSFQPSTGPTGSKFPIPHEQPSVSGSPSCTSANCGSNPAYQHGSLGSSGFQSPSYSGANPSINCASGNCPSYPTSQPSAGPTGSKLPIAHGMPSVSGSPGCTSGTCGTNPAYQHGSFDFSGSQSPSYSGANPGTTCTSGNCATYPTQSGNVASGSKIPSHTGPMGQVPSGSPVQSGSGSCAFGNCPSHPSTPPTSSLVSNPGGKVPDYVALGVAGGATKPTSTGLFVPASIPSSQPSTVNLTPSSTSVTGGVHSQSSVFSSFNNDKEQVYTGGFGGPPGILKPFEFKAPTPNLASSNNNKPHCSTEQCDAQPGKDTSSNKHDLHAHDSGPCTSGNCGPESVKPHHGQSNTLSGAIAGAAATASSDAAVYTGGFGGPPGVLKPYDGGKIGHSAAISGDKHIAGLGGHDGHSSGNNNAYGVQSGAASIANAGAFGSGSYGGGHNKAGGCDSGCGASGHGSFGGDFGLAGGISKTGLLEKLHNGAQSVSSAVSGAGANSFAVGGSFASSSASAHSAGSATKGGYGR